MTTAYDKLDYHADAAVRGGQPEAHAFTHIGLYLGWLIRHDLHNPDLIRDDWASEIKSGDMTASDLSNAIDGTLASDLMTPEGAAFSDAYYQVYLDDYGEVFAGIPDYGVPDTLESYAQVAPVIERRYQEWVAAGRPVRGLSDASTTGAPRGADVDEPPAFEDQLRTTADEQRFAFEPPPRTVDMPHRAPDLEALIPRDVTRPPMFATSVTATEWGDPLLRRALKRLGVSPRDVQVANGIGGEGAATMTVTLYAVPGAAAADLDREFVTVITLPPRGRWEDRSVGGKRIHWSSGRQFHVAFWTLDGLVVHASSASDPRALEHLVVRLP